MEKPERSRKILSGCWACTSAAAFARRDGALAGALRVAARRGAPPLWARAGDHAERPYWTGVNLFEVLRAPHDAGVSDRSRTFSVAMR